MQKPSRVYATKNSRLTSSQSQIISWLAGCINRIHREARQEREDFKSFLSELCLTSTLPSVAVQAFAVQIRNYELSPPPPQPGRDPVIPGRDPALLDGHPRVGIHFLSEFSRVGLIGDGFGFWDDWLCIVFKDEESIKAKGLGFFVKHP